MSVIAITGGSGFVGSAMIEKLREINKQAVVFSRHQMVLPAGFSLSIIQGIDGNTDYGAGLEGVECIIHCAARVHVMQDTTALDPLTLYREVNTKGTLNLARQAVAAGVKRFIFVSSIKVNGEYTEPDCPFQADDDFIPTDPYALSKYEAEQGLRKIASETSLEVVIIRPPLIYGPGVKANFSQMMKWIVKGVPLPLGGITHNRRSLISISNFVDFISLCIEHPNAAQQTLLVSDDNDISTQKLLSNMASALNAPNRLINIPVFLLTLAAKSIGKPDISQRLCGSLQVDISHTKKVLGWSPPHDVAQCMQKTAEHFKSHRL